MDTWHTSTDPTFLLSLVPYRTVRKELLLCQALCSRVADNVRNEYILNLYAVGERYCEGFADGQQLKYAHETACYNQFDTDPEFIEQQSGYSILHGVKGNGELLAHEIIEPLIDVAQAVAEQAASERIWGTPGIRHRERELAELDVREAATRREHRIQSDLIRCILGNYLSGFVPVPGWRTSTVVALATGIYADRAWDRLPVLAYALNAAGCTDPDVLGHLRGPGPHARGCWVVDLILGKS